MPCENYERYCQLLSTLKMSGPVKRRAGAPAASGKSESDDQILPNEEIQVDFEGRTPQEPDFHGIKTLLQQLFLKAHVNLSGLAELIIGQNHVGSVIKQSDLDVPDDELEEDGEDANDVFGITTVVPLTHKHDIECIQQIRQLLSDLSEEHASDSVKQLVQKVLTSRCGLFLNERLVNIPPQISAPLFESLREEVQKAASKNDLFSFEYLIMICKMYKPDTSKGNKKNKNQELGVIWSNAEEEIIQPESLGSFDFTVKTESDSGLMGNWLEDDHSLVPYRNILIIDAKKFDTIVTTVKEYVS